MFWQVSTDESNIDIDIVISQEEKYEEWSSRYLETCFNASLNLWHTV